MLKTLFHIDMDAFFASCEQMVKPEYRHQPLVVANHSKRAIVTTASYEARPYGVKTAMPLYKAFKLCPNLIVAEPHFALYSQTANRVWNLIRKRYTKIIEVMSIDEALLDVTHVIDKYDSPEDLAQQIRNDVYQAFGLTCSIGIGYTRLLAKMASEFNKPNGQARVTPENLQHVVWSLPIDKIPMVGQSTQKALETAFGIKTVGDLTKVNRQDLSHLLGKNGLVLLNQILGQGDNHVNPYLQKPKSISHEITLEIPLTNIEELEDLLFTLTQNNLIRLRRQQMVTQRVGVSIRYRWENKNHEEFDKTKHLKRIGKQLTLASPTTDLEIIYRGLKDCFESLYTEGRAVILLGVTFYKLRNNNYFYQASIDDQIPEHFRPELNQLILDINHRLKSQKVYYGSHLAIQEDRYLKDYQEVKLNNEIRKEKQK